MTIMMMNGDDKHSHHFNTDADKEVSVPGIVSIHTILHAQKIMMMHTKSSINLKIKNV